MQPVNDDMDNLFRRAAQDYPLNTHAPNFDFNKVQQQMDAEEVLPEKKEHRRRFLWLLFLLPFTFVFEHHYYHSAGTNQTKAQQHTNRRPANRDATYQQSVSSPGGDTTTTSTVTNNKQIIRTNKEVTPGTNTATKIETSKKEIKSLVKSRIADNPGNAKVSSQKSEPATIHTTTYQPSSSRKKRNQNKVVKKGIEKQVADQQTGLLATTNTAKDISLEKGKAAILQTSPLVAGTDTAKSAAVDSLKNTASQIDSAGKNGAETAKKKDSTENATAQKNKALKSVKQKGFVYAGLAAGPDFSVVKSLKTSGTGYNAGLIVGYRLGRHWAIESGITWDHKKYYSDGKYVTTTKLALQQHSEVLYVDGSCGMFEIPLVVQYHFNTQKRHSWYVAAGLSSYIMKEEEYYYLYKRYNAEYYSEKTYSNSSKNWLSVLQLSMGYQLQLKHRGSIRIEPYVKLPVSGLGIGKLPLSSAGINIGYLLPFK